MRRHDDELTEFSRGKQPPAPLRIVKPKVIAADLEMQTKYLAWQSPRFGRYGEVFASLEPKALQRRIELAIGRFSNHFTA